MYVTVRRYSGVTASADEIRQRGQGASAIIQEMPGFVAWYLADAGGGTWLSVSIFEDRTTAEESTVRVSQYIREHLADAFPNPPEVTTGEVAMHSV